MRAHFVAAAVIALILGACGADTTEPSVAIQDESCLSSDPSNWPAGAPDIVLTNDSMSRGALIMGTYNDGFGREDLIAYGTDISTRPPFINALEIFEAAPGSSATVLFDHGPGTYFMACMPETDTMVVLDDVTVDR